MQVLATTTFTMDTLGADSGTDWEINEAFPFNLSNVPWEKRRSLSLRCRVRVEIFDQTGLRGSYKYRNPVQSTYGYFHAGHEDFVLDYDTLRWGNKEYRYDVTIDTSFAIQDRLSRFGLEYGSKAWALQNTSQATSCADLVITPASEEEPARARGAVSLGVGSSQSLLHPGQFSLQQIPYSAEEQDIALILDAQGAGLPYQFSGVLFPDLTLAITIDYLWLGAFVATAAVPYPPLITTTPQPQLYVYTCSTGNPNPAPGNPPCTPLEGYTGPDGNIFCEPLTS